MLCARRLLLIAASPGQVWTISSSNGQQGAWPRGSRQAMLQMTAKAVVLGGLHSSTFVAVAAAGERAMQSFQCALT